MVKSTRNVVWSLLLCFAFAGSLAAQQHPLPGSKSEAPVICTGCVGTNASGQPNAGLPTYPYGPPLKDFVGRYVDSDNTAQFQHIGFRTARAGRIRTASERRGTAPARMYIAIGEAVGAYSLDTFFSSRLPSGMVSVGTVKTGSPVGGFGRSPLEKILMWDGFLYPEAKAAQWHVPFQDGQTRLFDFDFDDRGYLYGAESVFGWGIVKDDGRNDATHFPKVVQMIQGGLAGVTTPSAYPNTLDDSRGIATPKVIVALHSGAKYYAIVSDLVRTRVIYDVTDATTPKYVATLNDDKKHGIKKWARDDASKRIAIIAGDDHLYIYDYADYVSGTGLPVVEYTSNAFADLSFDESGNLWAAETKNKLWKLTPSGGTYLTNAYTPYGTPTFEVSVMHAAAGHVVVAGIDRAGGRTGGAAYDVKLLKVDASGPQLVDIDRFFQRYYHEAPTGYAEPGPYTGAQLGVQIVKSGGKTYLMYSVLGLGDVFEIEGGNSISLSMKTNSFGTTNPNSKASENGPFVGDIVRFVANSSSATQAYDVTWLFGNPEAGGSANQGISGTGNEIAHQYTGYTTASQVTAAKTVQAATIQDSTIGGTLLVNLKVPTPRIGISGVNTPISANTSGVDLIAGSTFNDASDGSVESHYSTWTIDSTPTKLKPNETISVGAVGAHALSFQGSYGKYDSSTLTGSSLYNTPNLTLNYTVKPFKAALNAPTSDGTTVTFTATPSITTDSSVLSATTWNVNWTFTPGTSAGSVSTQSVQTQAVQAVNVGTIPSFQVPKSQVTPGSRITLEISVDPAGLSTPAQQYATFSVSTTLSTPDPAMDKVGCANAGSPCKFTARSASGGSVSDWTFAWTLKKDGVTQKTGTGNPFEPPITSPGNYSVTLKASKTIFDASVDSTFTAGGSLCAPVPDETDVAINKCFSNCTAGTPVEFSLSFRNGYSVQQCDTVTWTFGDNGTGSGSPVSHTYNAGGTYSVSMKIQNSNGSLTKNTSITISGTTGGGGDPGNGGSSCTVPTNADFTYSGSTSTCRAGIDCRTGESITFSAKRGTGNPQTCDDVLWDFGDNSATSTSRTPSHTYASVGTYTVTLTITNTKGSQEVQHTVNVVPPPSGNCSTAPTVGNFAVTYTGNSSGCTNTGGDCQAGETIAFESPNYYYVPGSCDSYDWDFGDGSAHVTTRTATHAYGSGGQTFQVKFKVSNAAGSATYTKNVKVAGSAATKPVPVLTYSLFPATGTKNKTITFTVSSSVPLTNGWTWSFGDGTANDTSQAGTAKQTSTITHTFANKGKFTVKVTGRNSEDLPTAPVGTAQAQIDIADAPPIPEYRYLLPVTAHTAGQGGSAWRTDVQIYNPDPQVSEAKPLVMQAEFKGKTYDLSMIKATHIYQDFLGMLLAQQKDDSGPVIITTKSATTPPQIWTRTYTQTAAGTFGQFIPAIRLDTAGGGAAALDGKYYLSGLRHDNRYRTNVGFLNPNASTITATITVFDDRHLGIKQFTRTLQPFQLDQFTLKTVVDNLPSDRPFSLEIEVPTGQWVVAYASYIDGMSNDPVFIQAVRDTEVASPDFSTTVLPGVGHTGAWRSDVTIFNPDTSAVQFDLRYYDAAGNQVATAPGIVLDPFKFLQYGDILKQGVLGNAPDGLGTLKIVATTPVPNTKYPMAFARTYNDDGANGTFGQGITAFSAARANVKVNKPALLAGVRNDSDYYTNIGLVNLTNSQVSATVTLLDPITGAAAGSIPYTLKPNESIVGQFNGFGSITSGTFKIEANGDVWAFASVIDKRTKDPEYVAATPLQVE